jgi:hypothetical protein
MMYIANGICYPGEPSPPLRVRQAKALADYKLWTLFTNGEERIYDVKPHLQYSAFVPLWDEPTFRAVYVDYGAPTWLDGTIDLSPETIYLKGDSP